MFRNIKIIEVSVAMIVSEPQVLPFEVTLAAMVSGTAGRRAGRADGKTQRIKCAVNGGDRSTVLDPPYVKNLL